MDQDQYCLIARGGERPGMYRVAETSDGVPASALIAETGPRKSAYRVAMSAEGRMVAVADKFGAITVYTVADELVQHSRFLHACTQTPMVVGLAFVGSTLLASAGTDGTIRVYELGTRSLVTKLSLTGIAFGLHGINTELMCALTRDAAGDHLVVWNLLQAKEVFRGPAFKIASNYLFAGLDSDAGRGLIAHGDRTGSLHVYDYRDGYRYRCINTGHGNYYGVLFHNGVIITAGETDGRICRWNPDTGTLIDAGEAADTVVGLARWDGKRILAACYPGHLRMIDVDPSLAVSHVIGQQDLRHLCGFPATTIDTRQQVQQQGQARRRLTRIRELFEAGSHREGYAEITALEKDGFRQTALEALAIVESAQGNLLDELETLLILTAQQPVTAESYQHIRRLAEVLEIVREPELAIQVLHSLVAIAPDRSEIETKISELEPHCIPYTEDVVALAGFPTVEMIRAEIRKFELLNRRFADPVAVHEKLQLPISSEVGLDSVAETLTTQKDGLIGEVNAQSLIWKRGTVTSQGTVLRIRPADQALLTSVECWIELRPSLNKQRPVVYHMLVPSGEASDPRWNDSVMQQLRSMDREGASSEWLHAMGEQIVRALVANGEDREASDDEMFL